MVLHANAQKPDVTDGLNCTKGKDGKIIACQGKNPVLTESEYVFIQSTLTEIANAISFRRRGKHDMIILVMHSVRRLWNQEGQIIKPTSTGKVSLHVQYKGCIYISRNQLLLTGRR